MNPEDIRDLFARFGPVSVRRMFGSAGIFSDERMIALVHDGVIYLKVDALTAPTFERENLEPFSYRRKGKPATLPYRRMPDRLYDDPDELAEWARAAEAAVRRRGAGKSKATAPRKRKRKG